MTRFDDHTDLVAWLAGYRRFRDWTTQEVSALAGVSNATLWRWEHGKRTPTIPHLQKWARALGLRLDLKLTNEEGYDLDPDGLLAVPGMPSVRDDQAGTGWPAAPQVGGDVTQVVRPVPADPAGTAGGVA